MAKPPRVQTTNETETGRNTQFKDTRTGQQMSRPEFVRQIEAGKYPDYHVRTVHGVKTPASNPNGREDDNLG